eukprot:763179-Hanusia_phi.AAC.1
MMRQSVGRRWREDEGESRRDEGEGGESRREEEAERLELRRVGRTRLGEGREDLALCQNPSGQLDDAKCDVETVEAVNTEQLHRILSELVNTTFFRLMHIKLDGKCNYFNQAVAEAKCSSSQQEPFSSWATPFSSPAPPAKEGGLCSLETGGGKEERTSAFDPFGPGRRITNKVDKTISKAESESLLNKDESCDDPSVPDFWLDM